MLNERIGNFILKKIIRIVTLLIAVSIISFMLVNISPIDPVQSYIGTDMMLVGPEQRTQIAEYWGLNEPPVSRFLHWGNALLHGDFGTSMIYRAPVLRVIGEKFFASVLLVGLAWLLSGLLGFVLGIVAAMKEDTWIDKSIKWYCFTLASTPTFWMALLVMLVFSVWLGWFPIGLGVPAGMLSQDVTIGDRFYHIALPALTLSIVGVANIALHTREKLITVLNSDYVLFARARGASDFSILYHHGLRNIALPAISLQFASLSELFGGSILAEQVFSYPGLGQATVDAGLRGDVPLLLGIVLFSALFIFTGNLIADILYKVIDPRMREVNK